MDSHLILSEINALKAEISELKIAIQTATGEDKHDLRNQIIATQNSLTELYKLLQQPAPALGNISSISISIHNFCLDIPFILYFNSSFMIGSTRNLAVESVFSYEPSNERKRRWDSLNPILDDMNLKSKKQDKSSAPFSSIRWDTVQSVFPMAKLTVNPITMPETKLELLHAQLMSIHQLYGQVISGKESKRLQFISPILNAVCILLPEVTITVEEDMKGVHVHASGRFEYVIHYHNKKVCIVEAKKDDMEQGQVQSLLGCEVVADLEKCSIVYAIVTNYIQWLFYKNTDSFIYSDDITLEVEHGIPNLYSLNKVTALIYGMLTDIKYSHESSVNESTL